MADAGHPDNDIVRANALAAAELKAACEVERAKLLKGEGDIEQVIRLENLAARAVKRLNIRPVPPTKPQGESLEDIAAELDHEGAGA